MASRQTKGATDEADRVQGTEQDIRKGSAGVRTASGPRDRGWHCDYMLEADAARTMARVPLRPDVVGSGDAESTAPAADSVCHKSADSDGQGGAEMTVKRCPCCGQPVGRSARIGHAVGIAIAGVLCGTVLMVVALGCAGIVRVVHGWLF